MTLNAGSVSLASKDGCAFIETPRRRDWYKWTEREVTPIEAFEKMIKNTKKAIEEHRVKRAHGYVMPWQMGELGCPKPFLGGTFFEKDHIGLRNTMEDAHFHMEFEMGILMGVFDGHGSSVEVKESVKLFSRYFEAQLIENYGHVHRTFEKLIDEIQKKILANADSNTGTTAVISFIERRTSFVYTATLGDSEANIYRKFRKRNCCIPSCWKEWRSIPLSVVRDWSYQKEADRMAIAQNDSRISIEWPMSSDPKTLRSQFYGGVNVSRALGDRDYVGTAEAPRVVHKPKITLYQMLPGDVLILSCDGIKDFVNEESIIKIVANSVKKIALIGDRLVHEALSMMYRQGRGDNITVIGLVT